MDDWTDDQYIRMVQGGNAKWNEYWETHGNKAAAAVPFFCNAVSEESKVLDRGELSRRIKFKYESNAARAYREALSLNAKACRLRDDRGSLIIPPSIPITRAPSPTLEEDVRLPEESPPSLQDLYKKAWPFAVSMMSSRKSQGLLLAWGMLGITSAYGVYWWGLHRKGGNGITSSLPTVNPVAHGYMGTTSMSDPHSNYNLLALAIAALTVAIPYFLLRQFAKKIAHTWLANRQDAFKSARNLFMDRIAIGRAQRLDRCDVYYPAISEGQELKAKCGLILYPGALVDRAAYAPIASRLSEMGILVAVANLEPTRVITSLKVYSVKEEVMHILSDSVLLSDQGTWTIDKWAIGGHSIGGHMAIAAVANEMSSTIKKVVLWGVLSYPGPNTYPCKQTLREIKDVDVLVVNGSNDKLIKSAKFEKDKAVNFEKKMPPTSSSSFADVSSGNKRGHTLHVTIEGGNHAGCAHYGPQMFPIVDGIRTITLEQQQRQMAEATADFLLGRNERE